MAEGDCDYVVYDDHRQPDLDFSITYEPERPSSPFSNSFAALFVGSLIVIITCVLTFVFEGYSVRVEKALNEIGARVRATPMNRYVPGLDGHLVYVAGATTSVGGVTDIALGVHAAGLKLKRHVEMYQWEEREENSGSNRRYEYRRVWSENAIASSRFHQQGYHDNPPFPQTGSQSFGAGDARINAFPVGAMATSRLPATDDLRPDPSVASNLQRTLGRPIHIAGGAYFAGRNPSSPQIGDLRIAYRYVPAGAASFIGKQEPAGLEPFRTHTGQAMLLAETGTHSAADLVAHGQERNQSEIWLWRAASILALFIGFFTLFMPVNILASYIPLVGGIVQGATMLMALVAALTVGPAVSALAWLTYRPIMALSVIAGLTLVALCIANLRHSRAPAFGRA
ncbi:TMEM43 family protein [Methylobacterium radiotolerans]|uniref:Uncharacterized protein n=1 Tax=Methylobacterium radiotolerans (strain ATCC 27329 / DSM 1819 / JCM 2831 / NBRC 15690 / NCIMB 10815 / 0-1) TaxID=426355 RepID=B1MA37_METRJ|nr:TMEM43 family protein [Methylobacterium radiotolerans]ACB28362.1 protein of unknown function DUF1625 [Methylobacterium radiotolerans JCM 2831]